MLLQARSLHQLMSMADIIGQRAYERSGVLLFSILPQFAIWPWVNHLVSLSH